MRRHLANIRRTSQVVHHHRDLDVDIEALNAPVINYHVLEDILLRARLAVRPARHSWQALAYCFLHRRRTGPVDIVHGSCHLPRGLVDHPAVPKVMTIQDMVSEVFPGTRRRLHLVTLKRRFVDKVDQMICISEGVRQDHERIYGPLNVPVTVIHHGVDPIVKPGGEPLAAVPKRYILHVGNREPYKDAQTLISAFTEIQADHPELGLALVGGETITAAETARLGSRGVAHKAFQASLLEWDMPRADAHASL